MSEAMRIPAPLKHADFRAYLFGAFFGLVGMWILRVTTAWLAWELTGSAGLVGLVAFLNFAPTMVSGPVFGVLADRADPRLGMMATQTAQALVAVVLAKTVLAEELTLPLLALLALLSGVAASAYHPLRMTLAPRLVPAEILPQAVAMTALNFNMTRMIGPAVGGWLIAAAGAGAAPVLAALLFAPQIWALMSLPPQPPAPRAEGPHGFRRFVADLTEGARHVRGRPAILEAFLLSGLFAVAGRGVLELLPAAADGLYGRGAAGLGALTAAAGAGAILSSIWLGRSAPDLAEMRRRARAASAVGLALVAALAAIPLWALALAAVAGLGAAGTVVGVSTQSIAQTGTPDRIRGRVMSLWILVGIGGAAGGALGLGALGDLVGLRAALLIGAGGSAAALAGLGRRRGVAPAE
ncbi:MAG: MFS transporter [Paracoccaceae bacterium]